MLLVKYFCSNKLKTVREFTCLGDRVSGGCESAVIAEQDVGGLRECGEMLYGRRFPLRLKGVVYKSSIRPAMLYGSEALCLNESDI